MHQCPQCENGRVTYDEPDGRRVTDACYHCGNTGFITDEQFEHDRLESLAIRLGGALAGEDAQSDPDPDGFDFAQYAAECGMTPHQMQMERAESYVQEIGPDLEKLSPNTLRAIFAVFNRLSEVTSVRRELPKPQAPQRPMVEADIPIESRNTVKLAPVTDA